MFHSWQTAYASLLRRFLMNFSYTFGKAIDNQSGDPVGTSYGPTTSSAVDSNNLRLDRGRADFDQTHVAIVT